MTRRYARSLKGSRAYNDAPYQRGKNLTLIGAMALRGLVGEMTLPGATDGLAFKTYVTQVLVPNLWQSCMCGDGQPPCPQSSWHPRGNCGGWGNTRLLVQGGTPRGEASPGDTPPLLTRFLPD